MVKRYYATLGPNFMRCTNLKIIVHVIKLHQERKFMGHVGVRLCSKKSSWAMLGSFSKMEKFMDDNCNSQYKAFFGKWGTIISIQNLLNTSHDNLIQTFPECMKKMKISQKMHQNITLRSTCYNPTFQTPSFLSLLEISMIFVQTTSRQYRT